MRPDCVLGDEEALGDLVGAEMLVEEQEHLELPRTQALRDRVGGADRVLAVTPEYNGTMPAVLNNAIDWLSRPYGQSALTGKPFGVVGTTPTPYGGKWSHEDARRSATVAGAHVVADIAISESTIDREDILAEVRRHALRRLKEVGRSTPGGS